VQRQELVDAKTAQGLDGGLGIEAVVPEVGAERIGQGDQDRDGRCAEPRGCLMDLGDHHGCIGPR